MVGIHWGFEGKSLASRVPIFKKIGVMENAK